MGQSFREVRRAAAAAQRNADSARTVLAEFPASAPRGSWPAEEFAAECRESGRPASVVMDLDSDSFLVVAPAGEQR